MILLSPLVVLVPFQATAPVLILVGFLMCSLIKDIDFLDFEEGFPALLGLILMPLTFSITVGIGAAFVSYVFIKVVVGKWRDVHPLMWIVAIAFAVYFGQSAISVAALAAAPRTGAPAGRAPVRSCSIPTMFERTALPDRAARHLPPVCPAPLALGRRLRARRITPRDAWRVGRRPLHGARDVQGHQRVPDDALAREAIEGFGGSSNAATDRESTVYWARLPVREVDRAFAVLGELIVRPTAAEPRTSPGSATSSSRRSAPIATIPASTCSTCSTGLLRRHAARLGDLPATRPACAAWPIGPSVASGGRLPTGEPGRLGRRRSRSCRGSSTWSRPRSGRATGRAGLRAGARAPGRTAVRVRQPRDDAGPTRARPAGAAARSPGQWTLEVLNCVLGDGVEQPALPAVREDAGLAYDVSSGLDRLRRLRHAAGLRRSRPRRLPAALDAILVELARLRDEPVPGDELTKAKRYLEGGMELRLDESRHVASWIGVQEALHDRVLDSRGGPGGGRGRDGR